MVAFLDLVYDDDEWNLRGLGVIGRNFLNIVDESEMWKNFVNFCNVRSLKLIRWRFIPSPARKKEYISVPQISAYQIFHTRNYADELLKNYNYFKIPFMSSSVPSLFKKIIPSKTHSIPSEIWIKSINISWTRLLA